MPVRSTLAPLVSRKRLQQLLGVQWRELQDFADRAGRFYDPFDVRAVSGPRSEKWRHIDNPLPRLKGLQRRILRKLLATAALPENMFGSMPGRDVTGHAKWHIGQRVVVTLDLRDCFPRTHDKTVYDAFRLYFGCSPEIASVLTKLTTYQHRLPQGAPTSSFLAQLTLVEMMDRIQSICTERALALSSYIDDIAWSGAGAQLAIGDVVRVVVEYGHRIRSKKKHIMKTDDERRITGLCVSGDRVTVPRSYVDAVADRIGALSQRLSLTSGERASVHGQIRYVQRYDETEGERLAALASGSLPQESSNGRDAHSVERRPCRHASRHEFRPTRSVRDAPLAE